MANLVVRNIDEAEHRLILADAPSLRPQKRSFIDYLASIPNVGKDSDFERQQSEKDYDVFT